MNDLHIHIKDSEVSFHLNHKGALRELPGTASCFSFAGAPKPGREVRVLCDGKRVGYEEADRAVTAIGEGWRLETPHELFAHVDYDHKNANGAYSKDESIEPLPYWTNQVSPWSSEARVVVYFDYGFVDSSGRYGTALARAVRVSGQ